jgi:hypothetical protein
VNRSTSQVDCQVTGLALDELELASLRGTVQDAALHVNFDTRMGRGNLKVAGPRFSGLQVTLVPPTGPTHTENTYDNTNIQYVGHHTLEKRLRWSCCSWVLPL